MGWPYQQKPPIGWPLDYDSGLVPDAGFWPMLEGSGGQVFDLSGNGNTGTFAAGAASPIWSAGNFGASLLFDDANNQYATLTTPPVIDYPFSIAVWVLIDDLTVNNTIIMIGVGAEIDQYFWLMHGQSTGHFRFIARNTEVKTAQSSLSTVQNKWHFVVGVAESATSRFIYLDGKYVGTNTDSVTFPAVDFASIGMARDSSPDASMSGKISSIMIFNRALSASEIALLYRYPWWMFKDPAEIALLGAYTVTPGGIVVLRRRMEAA